MFQKFRKDPNYLAKYHFTVASLLLCFNVGLLLFHPPQWTSVLWYLPALMMATSTNLRTVMLAAAYACVLSVFRPEFQIWHLALVIPSILLTFPFTAWIHSPSHDSLKPKWLNRPVGELMGLIQLTGFADWKILHVYHHQYPDHPDLDPHPPMQKKYWEFAFGMRAQIGKCFRNHYFKLFGQTELSVRRLKVFLAAAKLNMAMKVTFWYLVLGPQFFSYLFLTSIVFKMLHYSWFNYATHKLDQSGVRYEIINLDHWFYRWINLTAAGLYYHGNHHTNPHHHNPKHIPTPKSKVKAQEDTEEATISKAA